MKQDIRKINTWLPAFTGFYHSIFEPESPIERDLESCSDEELQEYYGDLGVDIEWLKENVFCHTNYSVIHNEAASIIADSLMDIDDLNIIKSVTYEKLVSPKYYNFSTDSINCEIEADFNAIAKYLNNNLDAFRQDREDRYTSCSGFISSYDSSLEYWLDSDNWDSHGLGSVLDFILKNEHGEDAEMDLYHACEDNALYEAAFHVDWLDETSLKAAYVKHLQNNIKEL